MSGKKTILIIEDDILYGEILCEAIKNFGYEVHLAYSATGGMDVIKSEKLDLIFSDLNMPGMSGIALAGTVRSMYLDIPIVLLTGIDSLSLIKEALAAGVNDYLVKPIALDDLPIVIEKNLAQHQLRSLERQSDKGRTLLKALKVLMRALDAKDHYTCGHSQRVAHLATLMGRELNLSAGDLYLLQLGAFLHDIGKIGIPDSILKKADNLEDYEYHIARDHPIIGSKIVGEITELSEIISIVRHHHERYDGQGYPDGLKGDAIPFFARIIAIIDAYEALVSHRVYRKGISKEQALLEIKHNAGHQFDPYLVNIFLRVMNQKFSEAPAMDEEIILAVSH